MKLMIGTAQFGLNYGIKRKKINNKELKKIFNYLKKKKLNYFDTSNSYADSERKIGGFKIKKNIITKIKLPKNRNLDLDKWLNIKINETLNKLKTNKLYGLLLHNTDDLKIKYLKNDIVESLKKLKKNKKVKNIGISIYTPDEIKKVLKLWIPDIVQLPLNFANTIFLKNNLIQKLKKKKIKICARSILLQGILLQKKIYIGNLNSKKIFKKYVLWCKENKLSQLEYCLNFIKKFDIDFAVLGFDNLVQLKEINSVFNKKYRKNFKKFVLKDKILLDPRKWS